MSQDPVCWCCSHATALIFLNALAKDTDKQSLGLCLSTKPSLSVPGCSISPGVFSGYILRQAICCYLNSMCPRRPIELPWKFPQTSIPSQGFGILVCLYYTPLVATFTEALSTAVVSCLVCFSRLCIPAQGLGGIYVYVPRNDHSNIGKWMSHSQESGSFVSRSGSVTVSFISHESVIFLVAPSLQWWRIFSRLEMTVPANQCPCTLWFKQRMKTAEKLWRGHILEDLVCLGFSALVAHWGCLGNSTGFWHRTVRFWNLPPPQVTIMCSLDWECWLALEHNAFTSVSGNWVFYLE